MGSDTIVAYDGHILEKPVDEADAVRMLETLQGNRHSVHTGVALVKVQQRQQHQHEGNDVKLVEAFTDTAQVTFSTLSTSDIASYVATGEPMDKAGSYGIQGIGGQLVTSIEGDFFTVSLVSGSTEDEWKCLFHMKAADSSSFHVFNSCTYIRSVR